MPVAFHVTYWKHLGWEDRFSEARFDRRQRAYANQWGDGTVYTPGFVIDGQEWRASRPKPGIEQLARRGSSQGQLRARITDGVARVTYQGGPTRPLTVHVALLGFDLSTEVRAGENKGRTLHHDFVALDYARTKLAPGAGIREVEVAIDTSAREAKRRGVAVWVGERDQPGPIQAAGGWLRR